MGLYPDRLEPCDSRWQLEQQRQELPFVEPEQQQPVERQQQRWLPAGFASAQQDYPPKRGG